MVFNHLCYNKQVDQAPCASWHQLSLLEGPSLAASSYWKSTAHTTVTSSSKVNLLPNILIFWMENRPRVRKSFPTSLPSPIPLWLCLTNDCPKKRPLIQTAPRNILWLRRYVCRGGSRRRGAENGKWEWEERGRQRRRGIYLIAANTRTENKK